MASANEAGETDMRRQLIESKTKGTRVLSHEGSRRSEAKRSQLRRLALEGLEARTLMATAPLPIVSGQTQLTTQTSATQSDDSSPWVAVDPVNPLKMVMAFTHRDPSNGTLTPITAGARFTVDGGQTWSTLGLPGNKTDISLTTGVPYTQGFAQGAGIGLDGSGNQFIYIGVLENDNGNTSGAVLVEKFNFNSNAPSFLAETAVRQWNRSDSAVTNAALEPAVENFSLAVDGGVASFTDPRSGVTQLDPNAGDVYVAMTVDTPPPSPAPPVWNRNTIAINASTDGINWAVPNNPFNAGATVGGTSNFSFEHDTDPKIAISQGKAGGNDGGLVSVVWDNFGSGATASPPVDFINASTLKFNSVTKVFTTVNTHQVTSTFVTGALDAQGTPAPYARATPSSLLGIGPAAAIAVDNTLGSFSQFQGRIYVTYVDRPLFNAPNNPTDNTDIFLVFSDNDGRTWSSPVQVNTDDSTIDGHSSATTSNDLGVHAAFIQGRPQYQPSIAVDPATGTVGLSWFDVRDDPSLTRYATYVTTSIDGGQTFSPQTFANFPIAPINAITGLPDVFGPLADNQSTSAGSAETNLGFGQHQALIFANGALRPFWASDLDAVGTPGGQNTRLTIETASVTYPAGPRVIAATMGPVTTTTVNGFTFNNTFSAADHTPQIDGFSITFDRPVDVATMQTLLASQIQVFFNSPASITHTSIAVGSVSPLNSFFGGVEATTFFIRFTSPQSAVGTYSYQIGNYPTPNSAGIHDDIWNRLTSAGNKMDQNANGVAGETSDSFFAPTPLNPSSSAPPFDTTTLPLIVPGPSVTTTFVPGQAQTTDNLALNTPVSSLDVTFDRNMLPSSFTGTLGSVISIMGPNGAISGTFTFAPDPQVGENASFPRTFRITFPTQSVSGTYTIQINPDPRIKSESGFEVDANQNAGVALLFDQNTPGSTITTNLYSATNPATGSTTNLGVTIPAGGSVSSTITITDNYLIQSLLLALNITYPNDPDLTATITTPTNEVITLFSNVGNIGAPGTRQNFTNTVFTDSPTTSTGAPTTPIRNGAPPFFGQFLPAQPALYSALRGTQIQGTWTLTITNAGTTPTSTGTLNAWSLTAGETVGIGSGIGEPVADRTSTGFRIFTMAPTNPLSSGTMTPVGPAAANNNANVGTATAIAIDPADPSGNTAYVGGASGGVWKTTNFLTTSPIGPTYVPLTNTGPVNAVNIGSIAIFDRNNDPNQSIILVGTGDPDLFNSNGQHGSNAISRGVGFLISTNGGQTWTVLDSKVNDLNSQEIVESQRDKTFVGATVFKVLADPKPTPNGNIIFYAAISSPTAGVGGLYRSLDTGQTWTNVRPGNATDVVFDANSNVINAVSNPTGNIRTLYAAFQGDGVYTTPNQGQTWSKLNGGLGDPLYFEITTGKAVPVTNNPTPNGANGRIVLAKPALTGSAILDTQFETWLYAAVSGSDGTFNGLYLTKDNGANWTKIQLDTASFNFINGFPTETVPTNNTSKSALNVTNNHEGAYDLSLAVDPSNPSIVYLGGSLEAQSTTLIRVDTSRLADPYSLTVDTSRLTTGASTALDQLTDPVLPRTVPNQDFNPFISQGDPLFDPEVNLYRSPFDPFLSNSTLIVTGVQSISNSGSGAFWTPFESFLNIQEQNLPEQAFNVHTLVTMTDPTTGKTAPARA
jgi:subtilisin-like proprotein convertase family protein